MKMSFKVDHRALKSLEDIVPGRKVAHIYGHLSANEREIVTIVSSPTLYQNVPDNSDAFSLYDTWWVEVESEIESEFLQRILGKTTQRNWISLGDCNVTQSHNANCLIDYDEWLKDPSYWVDTELRDRMNEDRWIWEDDLDDRYEPLDDFYEVYDHDYGDWDDDNDRWEAHYLDRLYKDMDERHDY